MAETPRVGVIANPSKEGAKRLLSDLMAEFEKRQVPVILEEGTAALASLEKGMPTAPTAPLIALADRVDLLVVLGGDGTILWVLRQLGEDIAPVAAINTGTLGFLTCAMAEESALLVEAIASGDYDTTSRVLIQGAFEREGEVVEEFVALNEVTLCRGSDSRVIHVEAWINGNFANRYTGDGLILATPTGSTAYSLSAGGPLVQPWADVFVITPICPHTIANRPLVVEGGAEVIFEAPEQRDDLSLLVDGQLISTISSTARIRLKKATFSLPLISLPGQSFYGILHQKLGWKGTAI